MKYIAVSILDVKLECFGRPAFVRAKAEAVRSFSDEVNRPSADNPLNGHPEDFALYFLGEFDDESGRFVSPDRPEMLVQAINVVRRE